MRRGCIFDVDGVLLDSIPAYRRAWGAWAVEHDVREAAIWAVAHGRRPLDIIRAAAGKLNETASLRRFESLIRTEYEAVEALDGAHGLLERLPPAAWTTATSGNRDLVERAFARLRLPKPHTGVCGEDVSVGKPDPGCYLLAAGRMGMTPSECIVIEDAPAGVAAGKAAGMTVIAVTTTHTAKDLREADQVHGSLPEAADAILAELGGGAGPG
ncbi:HAD-IA family hydrolase [Nonomuraea sp. B12E4]|uniref:HAD-IA family hydrolase n=1 Tax=Nonomuraea sp. B12E4 TaxID=3153564 RepID=UPI00325E3592